MMLAMMALFVDGCGQDRIIKEYVPVPGPPVGGGQTPVGGRPSYQETQALLLTNCQSCHSTAQFLNSERSLRASAVQSRVRSGSMPPSNAPRSLGSAERRKILSFF
jgi:hypothetical protein